MKLIAGKLNSDNNVRFWKVEEGIKTKIGSYAIVENKKDYDLVKVVGIINTSEKYEKFIAGVNVSKKVVKYIKRSEIRED